MRAGRSYVATAIAIGVLSLAGCAAEDSAGQGSEFPRDQDWGDEGKYPGIGGAFQSLDALVGDCTFEGGVMTVEPSAAQTVIIGRRAIDSAVLVNGDTCATAAGVNATATTMKRLEFNGAASQNDILILDFLGGYFGAGVANPMNGGIVIDLGGDPADELRIRTTSAGDNIWVGSDGIAFNQDNYRDITVTGVSTLSLSTAGGNDNVRATNPASPATKGVSGAASIATFIYGGAGNDTVVGGDVVDNIYGGPGNDTLSGGAGNDLLFGEEGADTMQATDAADGTDTYDCGDESPSNTSIDVVSYDQRTESVTVVFGTVSPAADGLITYGAETDNIKLNCEGFTGGSDDDNITGNDNANVLSGGPGDDTISGGGGDDTLNGDAGDDTFSEGTAANGGDVFNGGAGTDLIDYSSRTGALTVTMDGSSANDGEANERDNVKADVENIYGGSADDTLTGNTGHNVMRGNGGNDVLSGGTGDDTFEESGTAANGGDTFNGGGGTDLVDYSSRTGALTVTMNGVAADDGYPGENDNVKADVENLYGSSADDTISGNDLNNKIEGRAGADTLNGLDGDDFIDGSNGGASDVNVIDCGPGADIGINQGSGAGASRVNCET